MSQDRDGQPSILPPEEAASANPESERVFAALAELVRLKDIKDRDGDSEDYRSNKDRAWEQARQIIGDRLHSSRGYNPAVARLGGPSRANQIRS